jgi:hypothetical protein
MARQRSDEEALADEGSRSEAKAADAAARRLRGIIKN